MRLPYRILVLEDDEHTLDGIVELLREAGHNVTGATTYDAAKRLLGVGPYDLLITDVRLRAFNGLHIVMRSRVDYPEMAVIIISGYDEPLMEIEASRYHATFVAKPIKAGEFLKTVSEMLSAVRRQRRWPRKRVVGGFRVTAAGRTAAVVDVCTVDCDSSCPIEGTFPKASTSRSPASVCTWKSSRSGPIRRTRPAAPCAALPSPRITPPLPAPGATSSIACPPDPREPPPELVN